MCAPFERNLSSYPARIDLQTGAASLFAQMQGKALDYFVEKDPFVEMLVQAWKYKESDIPRPAIEPEGYQFPEFNGDGTVKQMRLHKAMIDRVTGEGIRPLRALARSRCCPKPAPST